MTNHQHTIKARKRLIPYWGWFIISILSLLVALDNPVHGEGLSYMVGRFIGTLLVFAGFWALVVFLYRLTFRRSV